APPTHTLLGRDPTTNEPVKDATGKDETFNGWLDPNYKPAADATPFPDCWQDAFKSSSSPSASGSPSASATAAASSGGTTLKETAQGVAFQQTELTAPAGQGFVTQFTNNDAGTPHNIAIKRPDGSDASQAETSAG